MLACSSAPDVASVLNNLAVFYTNERRFAEAEKTHLRALAIREKFHPPTHPDIAHKLYALTARRGYIEANQIAVLTR